MTLDWSPLTTEMSRWRAEGRTIPIWWRDDDAVAVTPELEQLQNLSVITGVPVHLAVIPAGAKSDLATFTAERPNLLPLVHGWSHTNNAPHGEKKAEFSVSLDPEDMARDCKTGLTTMRSLFGDAMWPVFVPPWNRAPDTLISRLADLGFTAISTFKPRNATHAAPGLQRINTHLDPINWRQDKVLVAGDRLIAQIADQFAARREGRADAEEPYGLLTHHLVHDETIWSFTRDLLSRLCDGPIRLWTARELTPAEGKV